MAIQAKNVIFVLTHPRALIGKMLGEIWTFFHSHDPWLSRKAVEFCNEHLKKDMLVFEWGSGRSSIWFAKRVKKVYSIEHHDGWASRVRQMAIASGVDNLDVKYVAMDHPESEPSGRHYDVVPNYVEAIHRTSEKNFDFVVIDGAYRMACVVAAIPRIKPGGTLLVDNTDWMPLEAWGVPNDWKIIHRSQGFEGQTTLWQKPR